MNRFTVRAFQAEDREQLQAVRELAFRPIYEGFREQLGDEIFAAVRGDEEQKQAEYLDTIMAGRERTELHVLLEGDTIAGFITLTVDKDGVQGEIDSECY